MVRLLPSYASEVWTITENKRKTGTAVACLPGSVSEVMIFERKNRLITVHTEFWTTVIDYRNILKEWKLYWYTRKKECWKTTFR